MLDKSVLWSVFIGEEAVDARAPNFGSLSNERGAQGTASSLGL